MPSSVIRSFAYDPDDRLLAVTFQTGKRYAYRDVPADVADELRCASSQGAYFNALIRDHYPFERMR